MQIIGEQLWLTKTLKSKEKCYDGLRLWKEKCENEVERKKQMSFSITSIWKLEIDTDELNYKVELETQM